MADRALLEREFDVQISQRRAWSYSPALRTLVGHAVETPPPPSPRRSSESKFGKFCNLVLREYPIITALFFIYLYHRLSTKAISNLPLPRLAAASYLF